MDSRYRWDSQCLVGSVLGLTHPEPKESMCGAERFGGIRIGALLRADQADSLLPD